MTNSVIKLVQCFQVEIKSTLASFCKKKQIKILQKNQYCSIAFEVCAGKIHLYMYTKEGALYEDDGVCVYF